MLQRYVMQEETEPNFLMFMLRSQGEVGRRGATGESKSTEHYHCLSPPTALTSGSDGCRNCYRLSG